MIISKILQLLLAIVNLVVGLIPKIDFNFDLVGPLAAVGKAFGYIDVFISLDVLFLCIAATIVVDNFSLLVKILSFIWSKIPFIG